MKLPLYGVSKKYLLYIILSCFCNRLFSGFKFVTWKLQGLRLLFIRSLAVSISSDSLGQKIAGCCPCCWERIYQGWKNNKREMGKGGLLLLRRRKKCGCWLLQEKENWEKEEKEQIEKRKERRRRREVTEKVAACD